MTKATLATPERWEPPTLPRNNATPAELYLILQRALSYRALDDDNQRAGFSPPLIGDSFPIQKLKIQLQQYADSPFPVLIEGESRSGKEIVANSCLHQDTKRRNLGTPGVHLPEPLRQKQDILKKRQMTHCSSMKSGELPLKLQAKLLRVLKNGEY